MDAGTSSDRAAEDTLMDRLERCIVQDLAGRGLKSKPQDNLLTRCRGNLAAAARQLAAERGPVAILTGFYVPGPAGPTIETDGPGGSLVLASVLAALDYEVILITDPLGKPALSAGIDAMRLPTGAAQLIVFPFDDPDTQSPSRRSNEPALSRRAQEFAQAFFRSGPGGELSYLIAVERAGPSRDVRQVAYGDRELELFMRLCPEEHRNQVHDFRGGVITAYTAKTHLLFDFVRENNLPVRTVGIGDGGNELGMGSIPWQVLHQNIVGGLGARIACRVPADWTITCGVSNWGGYALAAAIARLCGRPELILQWGLQRERDVLAALVDSGAIDGMTRRRELTVDSLPWEQHARVWQEIRTALGPPSPLALG